jgi:hypothetical protein
VAEAFGVSVEVSGELRVKNSELELLYDPVRRSEDTLPTVFVCNFAPIRENPPPRFTHAVHMLHELKQYNNKVATPA